MAIQWFPGHMHKARKEMARVLPEVDVVIEVLDARMPWSSQNPIIARLRHDKPCLRVLARDDLADPEATATWLRYLANEGANTDHDTCMALCTEDADQVRALLPQLKAMVPAANTQGSRVRPWQAMVVGIPNVGKSTLINRLLGRRIAKTGNEPAVTRQQQLIPLDKAGARGWVLRDTPGVLWPNVENPASGFRLAAAGSVRDTAMDSAEVAVHLLDTLCHAYPDLLQTRYSTQEPLPLQDSTATLEAIGRLRG